MKTRRREMLVGAITAVASGGSLPTPAIAQGIKELELVTSWPEGSPGHQGSADPVSWMGPSCQKLAIEIRGGWRRARQGKTVGAHHA